MKKIGCVFSTLIIVYTSITAFADPVTVENDLLVKCRFVSFIEDGRPIGEDRITDTVLMRFPKAESLIVPETPVSGALKYVFGVGRILEEANVQILNQNNQLISTRAKIDIEVKASGSRKDLFLSIEILNPFTGRQEVLTDTRLNQDVTRTLHYSELVFGHPQGRGNLGNGELYQQVVFCGYISQRDL